jgi:hypothetical protein
MHDIIKNLQDPPLSPFQVFKLNPKIFGVWGLKDQSSFESNDIYTIWKVFKKLQCGGLKFSK